MLLLPLLMRLQPTEACCSPLQQGFQSPPAHGKPSLPATCSTTQHGRGIANGPLLAGLGALTSLVHRVHRLAVPASSRAGAVQLHWCRKAHCSLMSAPYCWQPVREKHVIGHVWSTSSLGLLPSISVSTTHLAGCAVAYVEVGCNCGGKPKHC